MENTPSQLAILERKAIEQVRPRLCTTNYCPNQSITISA
jgi:hypothetical protein